MKQPKVYVKYLNKVLEVESIRFDTKVVVVYDESCNIYRYFGFEDVEFMGNTGLKDKNGVEIHLGDIVEILEKHFEVKYKSFKGFVIESEKHIDSIYLSLEANNTSACVVGNIYENKELLED
ncbi:YopX family protein [uncultured Gemella sp.]|uniref:YopX family protein n=1 Tax=uncultured Gemella sp. TaxID=254352 RepID=UPI0028D59232|nr:YopX family protein [uncultured Gemella sp.]